MPQDNPNPKGSRLKRFFNRKNPRLTYRSFNYEIYKDLRTKMENFRRNAFGEKIEEIWRTLNHSYLPETHDKFDNFFADIEVDVDGNLSPSKLGFNESDDLERYKEPIVAVKIHTALSILTQRTPNVQWASDSDLYKERAEVLDALRKRDWKDEQTRAQYTLLWFYNILFGTAYWRRYYVKETRDVHYASSIDLAEDKIKYSKGKIVDFDQTTGEALSPLQVWIDPSTRPGKPRSMRYVKYDKVYDYQTFLRLFKGVARAKDLEKVIPTTIKDHSGDDNVKCEFFEHKDLDLYYVVANDKPILKSHLPNNHKQLSVKMVTWMPRSSRSPFGLGPIEMMQESKDALHDFFSMTMNQVKFSIFKAAFYTGSVNFDNEEGDEVRIRPDRMIKASNPKDIKFFEVPGPGRDSWEAVNAHRGRIDEASGINRPLGGEITGTTAFETDLAKDAALARLGVPIASIVNALAWDAEIMFELQKQHYSLPDVTEMVDPDEIEQAIEEMKRVNLDPEGKAKFDIWFDETDPDNPRVFRGDYRTASLSREAEDMSAQAELASEEVLLTPEVFDWKGKIHVVADSILQITPTLERTKKLEFYNLIIPMFQQPPELAAKPARALAKLYSESYKDLFPEFWIDYLRQVDSRKAPPTSYEALAMRFQQVQQGPQPGPNFEQMGPDQVVTNVNGQRNAQAAASEANNPS
jgi:hypothetical protein